MPEGLNNVMNEEEKVIIQSDSNQKMLTFLSDDIYFGVNTDYVTEIITNYTVTVLPMVPPFIKGIINLRGQIVPIIDIRLRMHKPTIEYTDSSCIIVLSINSVFIGVIVDSVSQVVDIPEGQVSSMPANNKQELVNGMISLAEDHVVLMLDCELLVNN